MKYTLTTTGCCIAVLAAFSLAAGAEPGASASGATPCPDPAADIELALISKTGPSAGRVRITAVVKNLGAAAWTATSPSHHLQMLLARRDDGARPEGKPVQPAIAIRHLAPGQQYRIDHQLDWETTKHATYPRFVVRLSDSGQAGAPPAAYSLDCRSANNRKEITAADINRLFQPAAPEKPLKVQGYHLLGGIGVNTVETKLVYHHSSANAGKLTASVAAPYSGTSDEVPVSEKSGTAQIRVHIPCDVKETSGPVARPVTITYRLWSSLGLPGGSASAPSFSIKQSIPYHELCGSGPAGKTSQ